LKALIIGDAGSLFIKEYIEYVLLKKGYEVILLQEGSICENYQQFYTQNNVKIEPMIRAENRFIFMIPKIRAALGIKVWCHIMNKKYRHFDLLHIHGLNVSRGNIGKWLRDCTSKLVITVWGDEIFRKSDQVLRYYRQYYQLADHITVSTNAMYLRFVEAYGDIDLSCVTKNKFAIGLFDIIDRFNSEYTREYICEEFGIRSYNKYIVLVGHNGREAQRHFELTEQIKLLPERIKKQLLLVYTMTYGVKSKQYLDELESLVKETGCETVILRKFMNEEKAAKLRCISDVLLHAQLTDAFSASIQECFYAGTVIINGSWLPYDEIPNYHDSVLEYSNMEELPELIIDAIDHFETYKIRFSVNKQVLRNISSREVTTAAWCNNLLL
jgi:hypothetical protein